jgi:hypothetical protein
MDKSDPLASKYPAGKWRVRIATDWSTDDTEVFIWLEEHFGRGMWRASLKVEPIKPGTPGRDIPATITDTRADKDDNCALLPKLFQAMWEAGLRPKDYEQKATELTAVADNLAHERVLTGRLLRMVEHTISPKGFNTGSLT